MWAEEWLALVDRKEALVQRMYRDLRPTAINHSMALLHISVIKLKD